MKLETPQDALAVLAQELNVVMQLEPGIARARTITSMITAALKAMDAAEFEERLAALEQQLLGITAGRQ